MHNILFTIGVSGGAIVRKSSAAGGALCCLIRFQLGPMLPLIVTQNWVTLPFSAYLSFLELTPLLSVLISSVIMSSYLCSYKEQ